MDRKYDSAERAMEVAKQAVFLAWQACSGPAGMGVLQDKGPAQTSEQVWEHAYEQKDYSGRHRTDDRSSISCDYVMGRMMKLRFVVNGDSINHADYEPHIDYQAWCGKYPTYAALFDAAEAKQEA